MVPFEVFRPASSIADRIVTEWTDGGDTAEVV
jgi:hypothetical protein